MASPTAGDVLIERCWNGAWIRSSVSPATASTASSSRCGRGRTNPLHPGPPRRGGGLRRLRLCEIHRQPRRLHRHFGPRRHSSAQRALRRQAGRPTGARHHRPAVPRPVRHRDAAGRSARQALWTSPSTTPGSWGRRMWKMSPNSPAARRSPIAASRMSPCRSISSRRRSNRGRRSDRNVARHVSEVWADQPHAERRSARRAADILNAGKKTVILAGRGALGARAGIAGR